MVVKINRYDVTRFCVSKDEVKFPACAIELFDVVTDLLFRVVNFWYVVVGSYLSTVLRDNFAKTDCVKSSNLIHVSMSIAKTFSVHNSITNCVIATIITPILTIRQQV